MILGRECDPHPVTNPQTDKICTLRSRKVSDHLMSALRPDSYQSTRQQLGHDAFRHPLYRPLSASVLFSHKRLGTRENPRSVLGNSDHVLKVGRV